ncbi:hypothetical protein AB4G91_08285 [Macrococcoides goetzii]|uniref:hypothetical protein n=1 Tax=Macrococcus sp. PK TaxID=2801919 RepID=UPI001F0D32A9|nr:hypothetical protein [Macrococcus sp. PK]MCH4984505.1 hypothetical protein [Macrococcus sp. PK]
MLMMTMSLALILFLMVIFGIIAWVVIMLINSSKNAAKQNTSAIDNKLDAVEREHHRKNS